MSAQSPADVGIRVSRPWLDWILEALLPGPGGVFAPGLRGVWPVSHLVILGTTILVATVFALRCLLERELPIAWTWVFLPMAVFVGVVALQVTPLPVGLVESLAPGNAELWGKAMTEPEVSGGAPSALSLSLYPHGTWWFCASCSAPQPCSWWPSTSIAALRRSAGCCGV